MTEFEILKMKELQLDQLQELSGQWAAHFAFGWLASYAIMGPVVRSATHGWLLRFPIGLSVSLFMGVQAANWARPNRTFHELMSQPAPHGSYLRRSVREHFPVWWHKVSAELYANGYNFPEMNEYDKATELPRIHTSFDSKML